MATLSLAVLALLLWNSQSQAKIFQHHETPGKSFTAASVADAGRFPDIKLETGFQPLETVKTRPDTLSKRSGFYGYPGYPSDQNVSIICNNAIVPLIMREHCPLKTLTPLEYYQTRCIQGHSTNSVITK